MFWIGKHLFNRAALNYAAVFHYADAAA
jgi:hypothetical protein